jgi:hypothetical protein
LEVAPRTLVVAPIPKMDGQLRGDVVGGGTVPLFQTIADSPVEVRPSRCREPVIQRLLVELVDEAVSAGNGSVMPGRFARRLDELPATR